MRWKSGILVLLIFSSLIVQSSEANAFSLGSYCIKLSSASDSWQVPETGSFRSFNFTFVNSCQKTIPNLQIDFSEDISGGSTSRWNTLSDVFNIQNVNPGQQGSLQISLSYDKYISARNKIYLRVLERETITSGGNTTNTTNMTIQNITFVASKPTIAASPKPTVKSQKSTPSSSSSKKTISCSKTELSLYEKAKYQFILSNTQIQRANDIKKIVEDARQAKSKLLGYFVDYSQKDLYTLSRQDATISEYRTHRDEWKPTLEKLATKCKLPMPSTTEFLESYYQE